ncbi:hypothetical protein D3C76_1369350 [compost metagenome]
MPLLMLYALPRAEPVASKLLSNASLRLCTLVKSTLFRPLPMIARRPLRCIFSRRGKMLMSPAPVTKRGRRARVSRPNSWAPNTFCSARYLVAA